MAQWENIQDRGSVDDRRSLGGGKMGLTLSGVALIALVTVLSGGDTGDVVNNIFRAGVEQGIGAQTSSQPQAPDGYETFASTVLGSTNSFFTSELRKQGVRFKEPSLVLFRGETQSGCGGADQASGPHYCPEDKKIYLDETFYDKIGARIGLTKDDVAQAYVIAHEAGHHVQDELGLLGGSSKQDSIRTELQADCFAGAWAGSLRDQKVFESADEIQEAIQAAKAVGDDNIQKQSGQSINKSEWDHGSSQERMASFMNGFSAGTISVCGI